MLILVLVLMIVTSIIYFVSLKNINNNIIEQNYVFINEIYQKDKELAKSIIPIITGKHD